MYIDQTTLQGFNQVPLDKKKHETTITIYVTYTVQAIYYYTIKLNYKSIKFI